MKNILKVSTLILAGTMLAGCNIGGNSVAGKSFKYSSISTTYNDCTAEEFASNIAKAGFTSISEIELRLKDRLCSSANDGFEVDDVKVSNKTFYNGKETTIYKVNSISQDEFHSSSLCNFGVDPENKDIFHLYDSGSFDAATGNITVGLFKVMNLGSSGFNVYEYSYNVTFTDSGVTFDGSKLTINLAGVSSNHNGGTGDSVCKCTTTVIFNL